MPRKPKFTYSYGNQVWPQLGNVPATSFRCGYCDDKVSSDRGVQYLIVESNQKGTAALLLCPSCEGPTFVYPDKRELFPAPSMGTHVAHVPSELSTLYDEARGCASGSYFTACVLVCRKILMHIGVSLGAEQNKSFMAYVEYLASSGYVPPNGKTWVDHIRKKGNEANHEISIMSSQDAKDLISFIEMLLRFIYEFPNSIPSEI